MDKNIQEIWCDENDYLVDCNKNECVRKLQLSIM